MIVSVLGQKGGCGKTTTAISLACEWGERGRSVALVDVDPQRTSMTWAEVAEEQGRSAPLVVAMGPGLSRREQLPKLAARFDVTVVDGAPRLGRVQREAIVISDVVLLPTGPDPTDIWALAETLEMIEEARAVRPDLVVRVLLNKVRTQVLEGAAREALEGATVERLQTELPLLADFPRALQMGQAVCTYSPNGRAAQRVRAVVSEIEALSGVA